MKNIINKIKEYSQDIVFGTVFLGVSLFGAYQILNSSNGNSKNITPVTSEYTIPKVISYGDSGFAPLMEERKESSFENYTKGGLTVKLISPKKQIAKESKLENKIVNLNSQGKTNKNSFSHKGRFNCNQVSIAQNGNLRALVMENEKQLLYAADFDGKEGFETINIINKSDEEPINGDALKKYVNNIPGCPNLKTIWDDAVQENGK